MKKTDQVEEKQHEPLVGNSIFTLAQKYSTKKMKSDFATNVLDQSISIKRYLNYIGGKWVPSVYGSVFKNTNPADTRELVGTFPESGPDDVERAVQAAEKAYDRWRLLPAPKRGEIILQVGLLLKKHKERLARLMTREMGKIMNETRPSELLRQN